MPDLDKAKHLSLLMREALAFLVLACIAMIAVSLYSFHAEDPSMNQVTTVPAENILGIVGAWVSDMMYQLFGLASWLLVILGVVLVIRIVCAYRPYFAGWTSIFWFPFLIASTGLLHAHIRLESMQVFPWGVLPAGAGGALGTLLVGALSESLYAVGSDLVLIALMLSSFVIASHISLLALIQRIALGFIWFFQHLSPNFAKASSSLQQQWGNLCARFKARKQQAKPKKAEPEPKLVEKIEPEILQEPYEIPAAKHETIIPVPEKRAPVSEKRAPESEKRAPAPKKISPEPVKILPVAQKEEAVNQPVAGLEDLGFVLPSLSLFTQRRDTAHSYSAEALQMMSRLLEKKLLDYRVEGTIVAVQPGPVVVQFELEAAAGTKVSKVVALQDDLARSMSAISVRVAGNIPGRNVIGIELPNESREMVVLHDVLGSAAFADKKKMLPLALGVDIAGKAVVVDLAKMPHLLVAGTTGSGKSVSVNTMICSMLLAHTPETLRLIMVDPKMLELSMYDDIPHLLVPVVTSPHKANKALAWAVFEMERRYKLMSEARVRNLDGYNKQVSQQQHSDDAEAPETLPLIVIIIDELADLMMVAGKEVEQSICRLAQKARAAGLHLILATQRPSVDVITGLIKANLPSRLAFKVSSKIDSRTILDQMGAEQLLGMGDALLMSGSMNLKRVHGAFVDDDEVIALVEHLKTQGAPDYKDEVFSMSMDESDDAMGGSGGSEEKDAKYDEAAALVIEKGKCSVSMVQRYLRIGYNRASRIVEQMEEDGLVTPPGTAGSRKVLVRSEGGVVE